MLNPPAAVERTLERRNLIERAEPLRRHRRLQRQLRELLELEQNLIDQRGGND